MTEANESDRPEWNVELTFGKTVCPVHGEPFRADWPTGWLVFSVKLFEAVIATSDVIRERVGDDATRLDPVLAEFGPLCSLATEDQRLAAYREALKLAEFGKRGTCAACGRFALGTDYTANAGGRLRTRHVCAECVAGRECGS